MTSGESHKGNYNGAQWRKCQVELVGKQRIFKIKQETLEIKIENKWQ